MADKKRERGKEREKAGATEGRKKKKEIGREEKGNGPEKKKWTREMGPKRN